MSESAETYQAYVTGTIGQEFRYNDVHFDGFNGNALLDAKDHYEQFVDPKTGDWKDFFAISPSGVQSIVNRANRQVQAAQGAPSNGISMRKLPRNGSKSSSVTRA